MIPGEKAKESGGGAIQVEVSPPENSPGHGVSFREALLFWLRLGFINFGGPTGQIALMHEELVDRRRWISNERFLHALNYCMLLPGPEAQQLAIYIGWLLHRTLGGIVAGVLFVLPGFLLMLFLSWLEAVHGGAPSVAALFHGLRAAVIAIVAAATIRLGTKTLGSPLRVALAAVAFVGLFFFRLPFPAIVLGAGVFGFLVSLVRPGLLGAPPAHGKGPGGPDDVLPAVDRAAEAPHRPAMLRSIGVLAVGLLVWWLPLLIVLAWRGGNDVLSQEAVFFSKAAMLTFGGAYAVLVYIDQAAVERYGWIVKGQMVTGLGLAETTPGPLILVTEFVGFLGAYRNPGGLAPMLAGVLGACVTTWATFAPCFLWIFLGAPYIERLRGSRKLDGALSAITAAVVGVILNLAVELSIHTLFRSVEVFHAGPARIPVPLLGSIDLFALALAALAFAALRWWSWGIVPVVAGSALAGIVWKLVTGGA